MVSQNLQICKSFHYKAWHAVFPSTQHKTSTNQQHLWLHHKKETVKLVTITSLYQPSEICSLGKGKAISVCLSVKIMQFTSLGIQSDLLNTEFFIANSKMVFVTTYRECLKHVYVNTWPPKEVAWIYYVLMH